MRRLSDELSRASEAFKEFIRQDWIYYEIGDPHCAQGDWTHGDCFPLAFAVRKWLGSGRVMGLSTPDGTLHHVVVEKDGYVIDGDGIATRAQFLRRWRMELEGSPGGNFPLYLEPILRQRKKISRDIGGRDWRRDRRAGARGFVDKLARALQERFPVREGGWWS